MVQLTGGRPVLSNGCWLRVLCHFLTLTYAHTHTLRRLTDWTVVTNLVETTIWGDVLPKMVSRAEFLQVAPDRVPANGLEYHEWLCCATSKWDCVDVNCFPRDPFDGIRRWSPRRNHAAVTLEKTVFVLGGRARDLQDLQPAFSNGGIIGERGRWRERSVLRNDVWSTTDGCESVRLPGPSCTQRDRV